MKTLKDFQNTVWFFNYNGEIESATYAEFLSEYWNDETTSPRGVENREQVASVLIDESGDIITYSLNDRADLVAGEENGEQLKWGVYSWGAGGRGPARLVSELFDTQDEAQVKILEGFEFDMHNKNCDRPMPYDSFEEIEAERNERVLERIMDKIRYRY